MTATAVTTTPSWRSFLSVLVTGEPPRAVGTLPPTATAAQAARAMRRRHKDGAAAVAWWAPLEHILARPTCWLTMDAHGFITGARMGELRARDCMPPRAWLVLQVVAAAGDGGATRLTVCRDLAAPVPEAAVRHELQRLEAAGWLRRMKGRATYHLAREIRT